MMSSVICYSKIFFIRSDNANYYFHIYFQNDNDPTGEREHANNIICYELPKYTALAEKFYSVKKTQVHQLLLGDYTPYKYF